MDTDRQVWISLLWGQVWVASDLSESLWPLLWNSSLLFNQWLWKTYCIRWGLFSIGWSLITTILHWPKGYSGSLKGLGLTSTIWRAHTHTHTHTLCFSALGRCHSEQCSLRTYSSKLLMELTENARRRDVEFVVLHYLSLAIHQWQDWTGKEGLEQAC